MVDMQVGRLAGELVSAAFPAVMDLKFERVCQPFMMLHVNRSPAPAFLTCLPFCLPFYLPCSATIFCPLALIWPAVELLLLWLGPMGTMHGAEHM